jgi:hypothetical protein
MEEHTAKLKHVLVMLVHDLIGGCTLSHRILLKVRLELRNLVFDVVCDVADVHRALSPKGKQKGQRLVSKESTRQAENNRINM